MTRQFENSTSGTSTLKERSVFLPKEVFTAVKDERPTARIVLGGTVVTMLGTRMVHRNEAGTIRRVLVMVGSEIGWVNEDDISTT